MRAHSEYENVRFDDEKFRVVMFPYRDSFVPNENMSKVNFFHEQIEIKYFVDGASTIIVGDEIVEASKGDIVFINPYEFHSTVVNSGGNYHLIMIDLGFFNTSQFDCVDLKRIFITERSAFLHLIRDDERLCNIVKSAISEYTERKENYMEVIRCLLFEFFVLLKRNYVDSGNTTVVRGERFRQNVLIEPAIRKIMSEYSENITLTELAELCNMCKYHFCRVFKEGTGMTPMEYLMEYRIKNADIYLKTTDKSIADIAYECGFGDSAYFSRCYKKRRGISPTGARRNRT